MGKGKFCMADGDDHMPRNANQTYLGLVRLKL